MKKFLITLVLSCISLCVFSQEHLSFKGIPIEGSMTAFCQKLKDKGYTELERDNNTTLFNGDFTGELATIVVGATDDGNNVHSIVVGFDACSEWKTLVDTYDYYKELYTRKYGTPAASIENNPSRGDSNTMLMLALSQGTVTYVSDWSVAGGTIELFINKVGYTHGSVMIRYRDAQNIEAKFKSDLEDI